MRSLAATAIMALALLPLLSLSAATGPDTPADADIGGATTAETSDDAEASSDEPPDFVSVWTAAVAVIGLVLIVGMVRTAREHRLSANETRGRDVSNEE